MSRSQAHRIEQPAMTPADWIVLTLKVAAALVYLWAITSFLFVIGAIPPIGGAS